MSINLRKLNSITKYPSILTYHSLGEKGRLLPTLTPSPQHDGLFYFYEKVDGENARIVLLPNEDYVDFFIGSREELLYAKGDRIANPYGNIAELLKEVASQLTGVFDMETYENYALISIYVESYGGSTLKSKNYSSTKQQGYRFFDVIALTEDQLDELMSMELEQIARWRDNGGQPFFNEDQKKQFAEVTELEAAPLLNTTGNMPVTIEDTFEMLTRYGKTQVAIDGEGGKAEGIIVRSHDRRFIKKIRFEDYERTLRTR